MKYLSKQLRLCFTIVCVCFFSIAQGQDSLKKQKKISVLPVPAIGYSPETSNYFGVVSLFTLNLYQDNGETRSSNAKIEFNYTLNKQIILETEWNYFFRKEKWFTQGLIHFSKYPDFYYGLGPNTPENTGVNFESNRLKVDVNLLRKVGHKIFTGLGFRYFNYSNIVFDTIQYSQYTELNAAKNVGFRAVLLNDNRNNILTPTQGHYINLVYTFNTTNNNNNNYHQLSLDLRKYKHWQSGINHTLAFRFYNSFIIGTPPFYDYSLLGGDKLVRGYFFGRFRDKHLSTIQVEHRVKLFWIMKWATFGGVSLTYPNFTQVGNENLKPNFGVGLRFLVDKSENTSLRFDYAIGRNEQSGFYVSFGESF